MSSALFNSYTIKKQFFIHRLDVYCYEMWHIVRYYVSHNAFVRRYILV